VLTADGAVDMTGAGWDILDNDGSTSRATGATARTGRKEGHVGNPNARSDGVKNGTGKGKPRPKPKPRRRKKDMSRPASVIGGSWGCPFPPQADLNQIDRAAVTLSITVGTDGRAKSASVVSDPGYGFGAQARRCAMSKRYKPALNRDGKKITKTIVVRVRFTRS
jgi:protein TonB